MSHLTDIELLALAARHNLISSSKDMHEWSPSYNENLIAFAREAASSIQQAYHTERDLRGELQAEVADLETELRHKRLMNDLVTQGISVTRIAPSGIYKDNAEPTPWPKNLYFKNQEEQDAWAKENGYQPIPQQPEPQERLTGALLRRLFHENITPVGEMETEAEVTAWWKHYAARVRNADKMFTKEG